MEQQVLVIAPHPDDEVLGCGGSIAKLTAAGAKVHAGYLTSGELGSGEIPAGELGLLREREARAAVSVLGVDPDEASFLRIGDGAIDPHDLAQAEAVIRLSGGKGRSQRDIADEIRHAWLTDGNLPAYGVAVTISPDGGVRLAKRHWHAEIPAAD